jgi:oxygen-independent coproporphyrinogen-3 oxidase
MTALAAMQEQGLLTLDDSGIQVTELGWFFVRGVAMVFDKYLQANQNRARFSKII